MVPVKYVAGPLDSESQALIEAEGRDIGHLGPDSVGGAGTTAQSLSTMNEEPPDPHTQEFLFYTNQIDRENTSAAIAHELIEADNRTIMFCNYHSVTTLALEEIPCPVLLQPACNVGRDSRIQVKP